MVRGLFAGLLSIQQSRSNQGQARVDWFNPINAHHDLCRLAAIFEKSDRVSCPIRDQLVGWLGIAIAIRKG